MIDERRLLFIRVLVIGGLLSVFLIAPRLWLDDPFFGPFPVSEALPELRSPWDAIWLALLVLGLLPLLHPRIPWQWSTAWLALLLARCVWDRGTWQPYLLQYGAMLGLLAWADRARARSLGFPSPGDTLDALRLIVVAIYFWSGVSKFNSSFFESGIAMLVADLVGPDQAVFLQGFAPAVPVIETGFAIGLLFPRTRRLSVVAAAGMHVFILACIGPLGSSYNPIVWPWNGIMLWLLWLLFWDAPEARPASILRPGDDLLKRVVFVLFVVGPALGQLGWWNHYLSFPLYSAAVADARAYISPRIRELLPESAPVALDRPGDGKAYAYLPVAHWMEHEVGAFMPPHPENFIQTGRKLCGLATQDRDVVLIVVDAPPPWEPIGKQEQWTCSELRGRG